MFEEQTERSVRAELRGRGETAAGGERGSDHAAPLTLLRRQLLS